MGIWITLRPHHFLCLPGYKGKTYNDKHKTNWDTVSNLIEQDPQLRVMVVEGKDTLCFKCSNLCIDPFAKKLDEKVKKLLGLVYGQMYKYNEVHQRLKELLNPQKHAEFCGECHWRTLGFCKDTFEKASSIFPIIK